MSDKSINLRYFPLCESLSYGAPHNFLGERSLGITTGVEGARQEFLYSPRSCKPNAVRPAGEGRLLMALSQIARKLLGIETRVRCILKYIIIVF